MIRSLPLSILLLTALGGCAWVKMEPEGEQVRVARMGAELSGCTRRGEIGVSVRDKVGFYERNELKVRDELETLARNEAVKLGADTVQPLTPPSAGEQRFAAYVCDRAASRDSPAEEPPHVDEEAETFPVKEE